MVFPMFIAELNEESVFKLLPMNTPYSDSLLKFSIIFTLNFRNNILKSLYVLDFSLRKLTRENLE